MKVKGDGKMHDIGSVKNSENNIRSSRTVYRPMPIPEFRLSRQERLLRAVNSAASCLFSMEGDDFNKTIKESLKILGQGINADRIAIWKNYMKYDDVYVSRIETWNNPRTAGEKNDPIPGDLLIKKILPDWEKMTREQRPVNFHEGNMNEPHRTIAKNNGIRSVLIVPITTMGDYWGYLCLCSYTSERIYSSMDEKLLRSGGALIAAAIDRNETVWELIRARDEAEANIRANSVFLSRMSHKLRNPMNMIINLADVARNSPDKTEQCLEQIRTSSKHILAIANEILDISENSVSS